MPTAVELLAQRNDLDRQIAIANLDGLKAIRDALKSGKAGTLADEIEALLPQIASDNTLGTPFNQASAIVTTMRNVTSYFESEIARVQTIVDAQAEA